METESEKRQERKMLVNLANLGNAQLCSPGSSDENCTILGGLGALDVSTLICTTRMWYQEESPSSHLGTKPG